MFKLSGEDGNAFAILGRVKAALKNAGAPEQDLRDYMDNAMSGDYGNLLSVSVIALEAWEIDYE